MVSSIETGPVPLTTVGGNGCRRRPPTKTGGPVRAAAGGAEGGDGRPGDENEPCDHGLRLVAADIQAAARATRAALREAARCDLDTNRLRFQLWCLEMAHHQVLGADRYLHWGLCGGLGFETTEAHLS